MESRLLVRVLQGKPVNLVVRVQWLPQLIEKKVAEAVSVDYHPGFWELSHVLHQTTGRAAGYATTKHRPTSEVTWTLSLYDCTDFLTNGHSPLTPMNQRHNSVCQ